MFYDNLKKLCDANNVYMTNVLKELGFSTGGLGRWKEGAYPNSEIIVALAKHFKVSTDSLLLGDEHESSSLAETLHIEGINEEAIRLAIIWDQLDYAGKAITRGDIYKRYEDMKKEREEKKKQLDSAEDKPHSSGAEMAG